MHLKSQDNYSVVSTIVDYDLEEGEFNPQLSVAVKKLFMQDDIYNDLHLLLFLMRQFIKPFMLPRHHLSFYAQGSCSGAHQ
jgi:hypothetical protein